MNQTQLSFDELFDRVFISDDPVSVESGQIKAGDHISLMNKQTFEHRFDVVLYADDSLMITRRQMASDSPLNSCTQLYNLSKIDGAAGCYENEVYAVAKVHPVHKSAQWVKASLGTAFAQHCAREALKRIGKLR
ncbi:MAG: hypothetical protein QXL01_06670, partial [Thermoplasmatales archaeon]